MRGVLLSWVLLSSVAFAGADGYIERARAANFAQSNEWLRLVHYRPTALGGFRSEADGPAFFFAADGRTNPQAELDATIRALFSPVLPEHAHPDKEHPLCRFPARRTLLVRALGVDEAELPTPRCLKLDAFVRRVSAKSVTLSFSSYYLGNPSSVFGHTFLRLNKDEQTPDGREKELLDWGINYGGAVDTTNPVLYMLRGLTGGYRGEFLNLPYFYKVREYNDYESRDLWEYRLALEPHEVELLVFHLWELGHTWFDYYYVDENCSWHLLAALEAAAPRLSLVEHFKAAALPGDAIRAVHRTPGLVESFRYRPSLRTQFVRRARALDGEGLQAVHALEQDVGAAIPGEPKVQAAVIDTAMDHLDLKHAKEIVFHTSPEIEERRHKLMVRRSRLGLPSPDLSEKPPLDEAPHLAHASGRMGIGGGVSAGTAFAKLTYRFLLHDLLDPPTGYPTYMRMEVLPMELRYELGPGRGRIALEQLDIMRIEYLPAVTRFSADASHGIRLGLATIRDGGCDGCLVGRIEGGAGISAEPFAGGPLLFALGTAAVAGGPELNGILGSAVRVSAGARAGLRWHVAPWLSALASVDGWMHGEGRIRPAWTATGGARLHLSETFSLDLEARRLEDGPEFGATALMYY